MTREEQIKEAARVRADQYDHPSKWSDTYYGFIDGAKWADKHPQWIPVEEELPKASGDYIICEKRGFVREAHYFELDDLWMLHGGALVSPTHWMPMPMPPQGNED